MYGVCEHALNASVQNTESSWSKATIQSHFDPLKSHSNGTTILSVYRARKKYPIHLVCGSTALSLSQWNYLHLREALMNQSFSIGCVCVFAAFVYDHQGELDMTACWTECVLLPSYSFHCNRLCICRFSVATTRLLNTQYKCSSNWLIGIFFLRGRILSI